MLRDRYEIDKVFDEIAAKVSEMDPVLAQIDKLLDDETLYQMIHHDLAQRHEKTTQMGRPSTPVEVVLRMLAVKHLYNWSYAESEGQVRDSLVLRQFCRVYFETVPDDTTLLRWANQIRPETLVQFNQRLSQLAYQLKVTRGRKLRTDGTVVETNIAYPSDSKLLADGVRVLSRTLKRIQQVVDETGEMAFRWFRDRTRSARHQARQIQRAARQRSQNAKEEMRTAYQRLVDVAKASLRQGQTVLAQLPDAAAVSSFKAQLATLLPHVEQVIDQTMRRVFGGESVPAPEKLVSLFEPHTDIICRKKPGKETEFGHKVWLDEVEGGIITRWQTLRGNPPDADQWQPALDHHIQLFGRPPTQASGDRALYSPANEAYARERGVAHPILPKPGRKSPQRRLYEAQPWFKRGRRYHAGIEGRISVTKRKHGLDRCLYHGETGFERWLGWGVIANNLTKIGMKVATRDA